MSKIYSFGEYVLNRFQNVFYRGVWAFLYKNPQNISAHSSILSNVSRMKMIDCNIQQIIPYHSRKTMIDFTVVVWTKLAVFDFSEPLASDVVEMQFDLLCIGDLAKGLNDFFVYQVLEHRQDLSYDHALSDDLLFIINENQLEDYAKVILKKYYPEALTTPMEVDPWELAQRMNLTVMERRIRKDASIFGEAIFEEGVIECYSEQEDREVPLHIQKRTILVDPQVFYLRDLGSKNHTIIHECVHFYLHEKTFLLHRLCDSNVTQIMCDTVSDIMQPDWKEWQANKLALCIQMPLKPFCEKVHEWIDCFLRDMPQVHIADVLEKVIDVLAVFYKVSPYAVKMRLIDAGWDEALGVLNLIDGRKINAHAFKKNYINKYQTFCISARDAVNLYATSEKFRECLNTGNYLYMDSHFILNEEKYIVYDEAGTAYMTNYARLHMDECALVFDIQYSVETNGPAYYDINYAFLQENVTQKVQELRLSEINSWTKNEFLLYQKTIDELIDPGNSIADIVKKLIKLSGKSQFTILQDGGLGHNTLTRITKGITKHPKLSTMMQLCIGMGLTLDLGDILLRIAFNPYENNREYCAYRVLLSGSKPPTLDEANEFLINAGFKSLVREK